MPATLAGKRWSRYRSIQALPRAPLVRFSATRRWHRIGSIRLQVPLRRPHRQLFRRALVLRDGTLPTKASDAPPLTGVGRSTRFRPRSRKDAISVIARNSQRTPSGGIQRARDTVRTACTCCCCCCCCASDIRDILLKVERQCVLLIIGRFPEVAYAVLRVCIHFVRLEDLFHELLKRP